MGGWWWTWACLGPVAEARGDRDDLPPLHDAELEPPPLPAPFSPSPEQQAAIDAGQPVAIYERNGKHDSITAAITTRMNQWQVWSVLQAVDRYGEMVPLEWARLDTLKEQDGRTTMVARFKLDIPMLAGELSVSSTWSTKDGYLAFHMLEDKKGIPVNHAVGYWQIRELSPERTLVVVQADFNTPVPLPQEGMNQAVAAFIQGLVVETERRVYDQERWMRSSN